MMISRQSPERTPHALQVTQTMNELIVFFTTTLVNLHKWAMMLRLKKKNVYFILKLTLDREMIHP